MTAYIEMNKASCSLDAGFMSLHTVATKYMFYVLVENYLPYTIRWLLSTQFRNFISFCNRCTGECRVKHLILTAWVWLLLSTSFVLVYYETMAINDVITLISRRYVSYNTNNSSTALAYCCMWCHLIDRGNAQTLNNCTKWYFLLNHLCI